MFHPCVYSFWVPLADVTVSISRVLTDLIRCTGGARMHIFIIIAINGVLDCKCTIRECPAAKAACPGVEYQPRLKFFIRFLPINRRKIVPRRIFTKLYGQVFIASHKFLLGSSGRETAAPLTLVVMQLKHSNLPRLTVKASSARSSWTLRYSSQHSSSSPYGRGQKCVSLLKQSRQSLICRPPG